MRFAPLWSDPTWSLKAGPWRVRQPLRATRVRDVMRRAHEQPIPRRAERQGPSLAMLESRPIYGSGVFFPKKGNEPSGMVEQPRELSEPTTRNF
jgi:hypothetical protein